jgi:hypothetical protein
MVEEAAAALPALEAVAPPTALDALCVSVGAVLVDSTESLEQAVASANTVIAQRAIERFEREHKLTGGFMHTQDPQNTARSIKVQLKTDWTLTTGVSPPRRPQNRGGSPACARIALIEHACKSASR